MKKIMLSLCGLCLYLLSSAQLSVGVNANYTMYKQYVNQNKAGFGLRASYQWQEKVGLVLSYTHLGSITQPNEVIVMNNAGSVKTIPSEVRLKFNSFHLLANYTFVGDDESAGKFYGQFGAGLVLAKYDEVIKGEYDKATYTPTDQMEAGSQSGFTINLGLGGEYKIGTPSVFAEAGIALPANKVGSQYVVNNIPAHFIFNVGVKIPIGQE